MRNKKTSIKATISFPLPQAQLHFLHRRPPATTTPRAVLWRWRASDYGPHVTVPCCQSFLLTFFLCSSTGSPQTAFFSQVSICSSVGPPHAAAVRPSALPWGASSSAPFGFGLPSVVSHSFCFHLLGPTGGPPLS